MNYFETDEEVLICVFCGSDEDVTEGPDPFCLEIYDDDAPALICDECREFRAKEV